MDLRHIRQEQLSSDIDDVLQDRVPEGWRSHKLPGGTMVHYPANPHMPPKLYRPIAPQYVV